MTNELIAKAKECKSAEELLALAKENGYELTADEAAAKFAELHSEGELSDDELDSAAGGACGSKNNVYFPEEGDRVRAKRSTDKCKKCGGTIGICKNVSFSTLGTSEINLTCDTPNCTNTNWVIKALVEESYVEPA